MSTVEVSDEIRSRVSKGARLLDKERPGWADMINLEELEMNSCFQCILGQIFGHYDAGCREFDLGADAVLLGFDTTCRDSVTEMPMLAVAWEAEIRKRTEATP